MERKTHEALSPELVGVVVELAPGRAIVALDASPVMKADATGLVHGGFVFGLADHAAMLAINEPTVVLGSADVRFLAPVVVGDALRAMAEAEPPVGKKRPVRVEVRAGDVPVLTGVFTCFVPERHVLAGPPRGASSAG